MFISRDVVSERGLPGPYHTDTGRREQGLSPSKEAHQADHGPSKEMAASISTGLR